MERNSNTRESQVNTPDIKNEEQNWVHKIIKGLKIAKNIILLVILSVASFFYFIFFYFSFALVDLFPISNRLRQNLVGGLKIFAHEIMCVFFYFIAPSPIYLVEDANAIKQHKKSIIISNLESDVDWFLISQYLKRFNVVENLFIVIKEDLKNIPVLGYILRSMGHIFVARYEDRYRNAVISGKIAENAVVKNPVLSGEAANKILAKAANEIDMMQDGHILIFPEGTFRHQDSVKWSEEHLLKKNYIFENKKYSTKNVLVPREKGFRIIKENLTTADGIYNFTVVKNLLNHKFDCLKNIIEHFIYGKDNFDLILFAQFYPSRDLPRGIGSQKYLQELFCQKDSIIEKFMEKARAKANGGDYRIDGVDELKDIIKELGMKNKVKTSKMSLWTTHTTVSLISVPIFYVFLYFTLKHAFKLLLNVIPVAQPLVLY